MCMEVDIGLHGKGNSKLPWRKAGQTSHLVDVVDSDQKVVNKEPSLSLSVYVLYENEEGTSRASPAPPGCKPSRSPLHML